MGLFSHQPTSHGDPALDTSKKPASLRHPKRNTFHDQPVTVRDFIDQLGLLPSGYLR
jgi:hypothetical protein